jgi:hypothetical protein
VNILLHFHFDKGKETMQFWIGFIIISDDLALLGNIRKGHSQERAHVSEEHTKLIKNETKLMNGYLVFLIPNIINFLKSSHNLFQIESPLHFASLYYTNEFVY